MTENGRKIREQILELLASPDYRPLDKSELAKAFGRKSGVRDRKSTRLNSSHLVISYAVFCLKKKKQHVMELVIEKDRQPNLIRYSYKCPFHTQLYNLFLSCTLLHCFTTIHRSLDQFTI